MSGKRAPPDPSGVDINLVKSISMITLLVELSHKLYSSDVFDVNQRKQNYFERFESYISSETNFKTTI